MVGVIMKRSKNKRIIYGRIFTILIVLIIVICVVNLILNTDNDIYMLDVTNKDIDVVKEMLNDYNLDIEVSYKYNDNVEKNSVISQSINKNNIIKKGDKLILVVSLGKLDKDKLRADGINELGKVPIMMYHGIKNIPSSQTGYTGGNVDKDGYTRTAEAFRHDLDLYYKKGYRMIKLSDYINGEIDVEYGYSPIILTFDDGNENNIKVTGLDDNGNIIIDSNSAVGILEEYKKKYPDYNVTAIFFVTNALFNQPEYNDKILNWLVDNGYEVGNHTRGHDNFTKIDSDKTQEVVGYMYNKLESIIGDKYSKIVALPFGSPYNKEHDNYKYIINGSYDGGEYETVAALRVGWEPEVSPFNKSFDKTFLKRCRAYDNNGVDFDIEMTLRILDKNRYISDGDKNRVVTSIENNNIINTDINKELILY